MPEIGTKQNPAIIPQPSQIGGKLKNSIKLIIFLVWISNAFGQTQSGISLSGYVANMDSTPASDVSIRLKGQSLETKTDSKGYWFLSTPSSNIRHTFIAMQIPQMKITVTNGRMRLNLPRDHAGRIISKTNTQNEHPVPDVSAREAGRSIDTLVYLFNGAVFLKDTITPNNQKNIIRYYDTFANPNITYGYMLDSNNSIYRTILIGNQLWMAQNLRIKNQPGKPDSIGLCYQNNNDSCYKYGRFYTWPQIMVLDDSCYENSCTNEIKISHRGICPSGWHVPTYQEWDTLLMFAEKTNKIESVLLKSSSSWDPHSGIDKYGFSILGTGYCTDGSFSGVQWFANQWNANESDRFNSFFTGFTLLPTVNQTYALKSAGLTVRCISNAK